MPVRTDVRMLVDTASVPVKCRRARAAHRQYRSPRPEPTAAGVDADAEKHGEAAVA
jgi:hypothetical protein